MRVLFLESSKGLGLSYINLMSFIKTIGLLLFEVDVICQIYSE